MKTLNNDIGNEHGYEYRNNQQHNTMDSRNLTNAMDIPISSQGPRNTAGWLGQCEEKVASPLLLGEEDDSGDGSEDVTAQPVLCQSPRRSANKTVPAENHPIAISWNIQGLRTSKPDLDILIKEKQPAIICLQESMCSARKPPAINGYRIFHRQREGGRRAAGGVLTAVKTGIDAEEIQFDTNLEVIIVKVGPPLNVRVVNVYLPPREEISTRDLSDIITQTPNSVLLVGDLNAHHTIWGSRDISSRGRIVMEFIEENSLAVLNTGEPTHVNHSNGSFSCIDVAISSTDLAGQLEWTVSEDFHGSDHSPTFIAFPGTTRPRKTFPRWKIEEADWTSYQTDIKFERKYGAEEQIQEITRAILKSAERFIPKTKGFLGKKCVPWWNEEVAAAIKNRRKALRKLKSSSSGLEEKEQLAKQFREAREAARDVVFNAKKKSWVALADTFTVQTPVKEMWSKYRLIQGKNKNEMVNAIVCDGETVIDDNGIANCLGDSFQAISSNEAYGTRFTEWKEAAEAEEFQIDEENDSEYNQTFQYHELEEALEGLQGSSPGPDGVHYAMIANLPIDCKTQLLEAYNRLWVEGIFPIEWTRSIVVPLYKGKGERVNPRNYRPIYLNSCVGKVFERMVNNRLVHVLESNELLSKHQYAFRKGRTTVDHLAVLEETIRESLNKKQYAQVVFLDVTKAYDTTWRRLILQRLKDWKIDGSMLRFLHKMLERRTFNVLVNGTLSNEKSMETGLCQGSILSVTLFLIAIDTIMQYLPPDVKCLLYADDVILIATGENSESIRDTLQAALTKIEDWQYQTGYTISAEKSATVVFRNPRSRKPRLSGTLHLNGIGIPLNTSHKCLGITLDCFMKFRKHAEEVKAVCQQRINFIRSIAARAWGGDRNTLLKIYRATVLEKILYAAPILSGLDESALKYLETTHNSGLRALTGAFRTSPVVSLQVETGIPDLRTLLEERTAIFVARKAGLSGYHEVHNEENNSESSSNASSGEDDSSGEIWGSEPAREANTVTIRGTRVLQELNLVLPPTRTFTRAKCPPWERKPMRVDKSLHLLCKQGTSSTELQRTFGKMKNTKYRIHTPIYTDGSKKDGRCGFSVVVRDTILRKRVNDISSIFSAESIAIKEALSWVASQERVGAYIICTDSLSVVSALENRRIKNHWKDEVTMINNQIRCRGTEVVVCWVPSHIGIAGNERADKEAKKALEATHVDIESVDFKESKTLIKTHTNHKWQVEWTSTSNNKLREVKHSVKPYKRAVGTTRKESVILARLRIGHTLLTHKYLLDKEDPPVCRFCNSHLTVKHIFVDCIELGRERKKAGLTDNLKESLADDEETAKKVLKFLEEVQLLNTI